MSWDKHPAVRTGDDLPIGDRAADAVVRAMGSWRFIFIQSAIMGSWMVVNALPLVYHWDPRPWIMLNLVLSTEAALSASLILLASRRQDTRNAEVANSDHRMLIGISEHLGVPAKECLPESPGGVPTGEPWQCHPGAFDADWPDVSILAPQTFVNLEDVTVSGDLKLSTNWTTSLGRDCE